MPPYWRKVLTWEGGDAGRDRTGQSNVAEIAAMGGYAAWAAARGADPDRRLVSLGVTFDDGSAWPTLLDFGGVPVVADGEAELVFAIDCGAKVPFSLTSGRLASVEVTGEGQGQQAYNSKSVDFRGEEGCIRLVSYYARNERLRKYGLRIARGDQSGHCQMR